MDTTQALVIRQVRRLEAEAAKLEAEALARGIAKEDIRIITKIQSIDGNTRLVAVLAEEARKG